jgi:hypothetical protein
MYLSSTTVHVYCVHEDILLYRYIVYTVNTYGSKSCIMSIYIYMSLHCVYIHVVCPTSQYTFDTVHMNICVSTDTIVSDKRTVFHVYVCETQALFECLQGENSFKRPPPHNLRHPLIFYYGHPGDYCLKILENSAISD